jgi:hypothetical protein
LNVNYQPLVASLKAKFVFFHINASTAEGDAFHLQAKPLFRSTFAGEFDRPSGTDDALPGQARNLTENANDLACGSGRTGGSSDRSVGGYGPFGQRADGMDDLRAEIGGRFSVRIGRKSRALFLGWWHG